MARIVELFQKDPLALTPDNRATIVAHYREFRDQFARIKKDGTVKKVRKPRAKKTTELDQ